MKANNALIILWDGNNISEYLVGKIMETFVANGVAEAQDITVQLKDEDGIVKALLRDSDLNVNNSFVVNNEKNTAEAVKQSVIYIGKRFEASLKGTNDSIGSILTFMMDLSNAVTTARRNISFIGVGSRDELLTAIEILSTTNAVIPASLAKKYHFSQNVIDVIKKVYYNQ